MRRTEMWRATRLVVAALVALAALAACGSDDGTAEGSEDGDRAEQQEGYPVTIEHAVGETTIEQRPERIVTLNQQWTDALLALGEQPVAYVLDEANLETEPYPWQEGLLEDAEAITTNGTIPYEEIASYEPDLILANFLVTDESEYETLSEIAPTIPNLSEVVDDWQDHVEVLGEVLGEPDEAAEVVAEVEGELEAMAEELPGLEGKTFTFANYIEGDGIYVVADPEDGSTGFFTALGMQIAPQVLELEGADVGRVQLSFEQVELLDADFIGILTQGADPSALPGWDNLRAVRNGTVHEFEYTDVVGINTPSALSLPYVMDVVRPTLETVAAG